MVHILTASSDSIQKAADLLRSGGVVAIPTETVYGLAADARNAKAVARIFEAKGRPSFNPLIVHVYDMAAAAQISDMNEREMALAQNFWPGALTMILKRRADSGLSDLVSAGLPTVAVRVPVQRTARAILKTCGFPLAAPSANKSGSLSPTAPAHVVQSLGGAVEMVLADGSCAVGLESTVIDCSGEVPVILRPGTITAEDISAVLGCTVTYDLGNHGAPKSPGQLLKHYAPDTPVRLNAIDLEEGEALLAFGSTRFMGVKGRGAVSLLPGSMVRNLSEDGDLYEAAANLFSMLRALDLPEHKNIAVMNIPDAGIGIAINDRLRRAAAASGQKDD